MSVVIPNFIQDGFLFLIAINLWALTIQVIVIISRF